MDFDITQLDIERQLHDIDKFEMENDLYYFLSKAWPYIDSAPWVDSWAVGAMCEHLQAVCDGDIKRLLINIPPRHAKSSLVSVAFNAWVWAQSNHGPTSGPGVQFLSASYANQLALRDSVKTRRLIESPFYQKFWGNKFNLNSDQNTKSRFSNDQGGERLITSVGAAVTGEGGDCLVGDTRVDTPRGRVPISEIKVGDVVFGFDESQGKVVKKQVLASRRIPARNLYEVYASDGSTIRCSGDHPFFNPENGYRAANALGAGDRLCSLQRAPEQTHTNSPEFEMCVVRNRVPEASIRGAESADKKRNGCLLLKGLLPEASCREKLAQDLPDVREPGSEQTLLLLRSRVQGCVDASADADQKAEGLQVLPRGVYGQQHDPEILQRNLSKRASLNVYTGEPEPEARYRGEEALRGVPHSATPDHHRTGRRCVRGVWLVRAKADTEEWAKSGPTPRPSHRREPRKQQSRESHNAVCGLPQACASNDEVTVVSVERYRGEEQWMYDIQVEGTHNFFAEGILVHNCIIIDDPNSAAEAFSEATIQSTIDWWTGTMSTRLNNQKTGAYVVIQQRLAENDLTGHLLDKEGDRWTHLCLPMRFERDRSFVTSIGWQDPRTKEGELLSPDRFGEEEVSSLERTLGKYGAAGQLQQRPEPAGGGIIKRDWWQPWDDPAFPPMDYILASLDTAYTKNTERDPSAMTIWGVFTTDAHAIAGRTIGADGKPTYISREYNETAPKLMLMYAWTEHLEFHDLIKKVETTCRKFRVDKLLVENKAAGISLAQEMRRLYGAADFGIQLSDPKSLDKLARLFSVQHLFEEGIIHAPDKTWAETVITQVGQFPKGRHDDLCLVAGTKIATSRGDVNIEDVRKGDRILTPLGFRKVVACGKTGDAETVSRGPLRGTPNHPVFDVDKGWIILDTVSVATKFLRLTLCDLIRQTLRSTFVLTESATPEWAENGNTTLRPIAQTKSENSPRDCTLRSGNTPMVGRFLMGTKSTILMAIRLIAILLTWSAYRGACIGASLKDWTWKRFGQIWTGRGPWRLRGTNPKPGENGTGKTQQSISPPRGLRKLLIHLSLRTRGLVNGAESLSKPSIQEKDFAERPVEAQNPGMKEGFSSTPIRTTQPVYNLTVEEAHCYFANGVLVHNCDTVSQAIRHLRDIGMLTRSKERADDIARAITYPGGSDTPLYPV